MKKIALWSLFTLILFNNYSFSQWVTVAQLPVSELGDYPSISVPNCSTIVISGGSNNSPRVYLSTNSGQDFVNITGNIPGNELYCVYALNKDTIFTGDGGSPSGTGGNAKVYKTTNGGVIWDVILSTGGNNGFINGISFSLEVPDFGIIVSDPSLANDSFWIAKTFNRGNNWSITKAPNSAPFTTQNSLFVIDTSFYGFGLIVSPAKFYMTTNSGNSWVLKNLGLTGNSVSSVSFKSDKLTGIALSDLTMPNFARTTNAGINWQIVNAGATTTGVGIIKWIPGTSVFFLAAKDIKRSSDNGLTWSLMNTNGLDNFKQMDIFLSGVNTICAYAISASGKVIRYEGEPFGIDPKNTSIPKEFILEQNYPNPFNPVTTFKYSVPRSGKVKLSVYDIEGKELFVLTNSYHSAGNYIETLDLSGYASGLYLYRLEADKISITKKLVLLK